MTLDEAKALLNCESSYALAKALGVSRQAVHQWNALEIPKLRAYEVRTLRMRMRARAQYERMKALTTKGPVLDG